MNSGDREPIDGEVVREEGVSQLPAEHRPQGGAVAEHASTSASQAGTALFNPLDALPTDFSSHMRKRQDNYHALREALREMLVRGVDFDRIHIANKSKCPKPWECSYERNRGHYSGFQLLDPGADKVKDILGLRVSYDDVVGKYQNASLKGYEIKDVIIRCFLLGPGDVTVCEGVGACNVQGEASGNLSNALKKAQKRARVDAIRRLPGVSALFDDEFLGSIPPAPEPQQRRAPRPSRTDQEFGARQGGGGRELSKVPFGKHKDKPWHHPDIDEGYLTWVVENSNNQDAVVSAQNELQRRKLQSNAPAPRAAPEKEKFTQEHADFIESGFSDLDDAPGSDMPPLSAY